MDKTMWLDNYIKETGKVITDPFFLCLATAIAAVESAWGGSAITDGNLLNEIGMKAIPGKPSIVRKTHEAVGGTLHEQTAAFRGFASRKEQAESLLYLFRKSHYYEVARLLYILAFYSAYAPGRTDGIKDLVRVFNQMADGQMFPGIVPFQITDKPDEDTAMINHDAANQAVLVFAQLTEKTLKRKIA